MTTTTSLTSTTTTSTPLQPTCVTFIDGYFFALTPDTNTVNSSDIDNPYLWSSDAWLAYLAGADFAKRGTSAPIRAKKSRGNVIRVWTAGGNEWRVEYTGHYGLKGVVRV